MDFRNTLDHVIQGKNLSEAEMQSVMRSIMQGELSESQIAGLLVALRMKGETVDELTACARVMREFATKVEIDVSHPVDIVGTGGDTKGTFNISTTAAFVIAAAGGHVAKHNNRAVSSKSGSADVLESLGIRLELNPEQVGKCIKEIGIGFMFAPMHHQAMRHAVVPRRELGVRTLFNLLGPLTNPALVPNQLIGVFAKDKQQLVAQVMQKLGSRHTLVVHSDDGMDEISISAPTQVVELRDGQITSYQINPEQFGLDYADSSEVIVGDAEESKAMMNSVLNNESSAAKDIVAMNAGATIYVAGLTSDLTEGIRRAEEVIASGAAKEKLKQLTAFTQQF